MGRQYTGVCQAEKDGVTKQLVVKKLSGEETIIKKDKYQGQARKDNGGRLA